MFATAVHTRMLTEVLRVNVAFGHDASAWRQGQRGCACSRDVVGVHAHGMVRMLTGWCACSRDVVGVHAHGMVRMLTGWCACSRDVVGGSAPRLLRDTGAMEKTLPPTRPVSCPPLVLGV